MLGPGGPSVPGGGGIPFSTGLPVVQYFPPPRPPFSYATLGNPFYVDSAGGSVYPYDTWANAATTLTTIAAIDQPGNTIYCASTGSETSSGSPSWSWAGTATLPTKIISADKSSGEPPTSYATGYSVTGSGASSNLTVNAAAALVTFQGVTFISANTGAGAGITLSNNNQFVDCSFQLSGASGSAVISPAGSVWINCTVKFGAAAQFISTSVNNLFWSGGSILSGGVSPTSLFSVPPALLENVDLSNGSATMNLSAGPGAVQCRMRNIALPGSWSGSLSTGTPVSAGTLTLHNADSSGTNYVLHRQTQFGDVYNETTIVRTGGASNGTTSLSWKMVSVAASGTFPITALQSGEFVIWNDTTGSGKTITVEIVYDSATVLNNNQVWLEVNYYAASGNPQGTLVSSAPATVLTTATAIPTSTATWSGTGGFSNPQKGYLRVGPITPQLKGYFLATVKLCNASTTIYVDPLMTVA